MNQALLTLLLIAVPILCAGQSDASVPRPEIRVGDSWTYRSTNYFAPGTHEHETRVSFADNRVILVVSSSKSDGKEIDSSWTSEWNAVTSPSRFVFRPDSGLFRFPLHVGDQHEVKYELLRPRVSTVESSTTGSAKVVGWETVDVPAGQFRAIKVELDSTVQPVDGSRAFSRQGTFWYVPEVRRWVKFQIVTPRANISEELLEYKLTEN